jgi:hypothetical protein
MAVSPSPLDFSYLRPIKSEGQEVNAGGGWVPTNGAAEFRPPLGTGPQKSEAKIVKLPGSPR